MLALNKEYLEQHSQFMNDSFLKLEDEDTRSFTSVSVVSIPSDQVLTNYPERDYTSVASKFGISSKSAKRFYYFLCNQPTVSIVKYVSVKRELLNSTQLEKSITSTAFRRKGKKILKTKDYTSCTVKCNSIYNENATSNLIENEPLLSNEPLQKKKLTKRIKQNIHNYLKTLKSSHKVSLEKKLHPSKLSNNTVFDSDEEFQIFKFKNCQKFAEKDKIVANPFSIDEQARTSSPISKKKESFWTKKFGSIKNARLRKKTFFNNFKKEDESNVIDNEVQNENGLVQTNEQVNNKHGEIRNEEGVSAKMKCKRSRIYILSDDDTDSDVDIKTYDSLSVNCQQVNANIENNLNQSNNQLRPIISFGEGYDQYENEDRDEERSIDNIKEQDIHIQNNVINKSAASPESIIIKKETIFTTNNMRDRDNDDNSNDNLSDDLYDYVKKLDSPSDDRLVIDFTPTSSIESSPIKNDSTKFKGKPKIKSDTKLSNPIYNIPVRKKYEKSSLETSPSPLNVFAEINGVEKLSNEDNFNQPDLNGVNRQIKAISATPRTRGLKASLQKVKCNLNNKESVKEYHNAKTKITFGNDVDESFDEICQDITGLTNNESITLYKGSEDVEDSTNGIVLNYYSKRNTHKKENSMSLSVFNNNVSETHISTQIDPETTLPITSSKAFSSKLSGSNDQDRTATRPTRSFKKLVDVPRIPRKNSQSNKASSVSLSELRDPRLNKSLSPNKSLSVPATDVRVTRSSIQKSPGISSADPRLTRGQSRPRTSDPTTPTKILSRIESDEEVTIVDPRLRKRKEREEAERAAKLEQELSQSNNNASISEPQLSQVSQFGQSSPAAEKKRSVFQRLGSKEPSPEQNFLLNIIKSKKSTTLIKSHRGYETDDDNISLHPGISDFYESSDEDDNDSSPRHRKFESERYRKTTVTSEISSASSIMQYAPQQHRLSAKQRVGARVGVPVALGNRRAPTNALRASSTLATPIKTTTAANSLANRLGTQPASQLPRILPSTANATIANVPPPNLNVPPPPIRVSNSQFRANSPFNVDSFYQMNTEQMMQDQDNLIMDTDEHNVYFDGNDNMPSEFDHRSILDNKPNTTIIGLSDPKFTFFNKQCYKLLRDGKCKNELTTCKFQHQIYMLLKKIKTNDPPFIKAILETSIDQNFDYYLDKVWKEMLPIIKNDAFTIFTKLYKAGKRSQHFVIELLRYSLSTGAYTVNSCLEKIAPMLEENDSVTVQAICMAIKDKLEDGFCWETIKCICTKAAPPSDIVEIIMLQCLKRKKDRNHILEIDKLIKTKMIAYERNKIGQSLKKQFEELVTKQNPMVKDTETLGTMPLMNVTNNLTNGKNFQRESVNASKIVIQRNANSINSTVIKTVPQTPQSPDNTPNTSPNGNPFQTPEKDESTNFTQYTVNEVSVPEPKSVFRDKFWKLYAAVDNVSKGLTHKDYDYVWEQLDKFCQEPMPNEICKRGIYQILCKNVKTSEQHLSEVLKRAARKSTENTTRLLFEVAMHALVHLCDNGLWVMAAELLKNMTIFQPDVSHVTFVLISAEIHLANSEPIEALCLLQRTKVIRTNRDEWLVSDSKKVDEKHRNKVVFILLQALAHVEPEKAVFLYKELMADQYIYYYPIDLSRYLDKLTLLLFVHRRLDLAVEITRLVMANDMTFQKPTYQEILSRLLPVDDILVNQILDYAVHLGYYPDINIRQGFTTLIIDVNYTEEEIYLMLKRLIRQLTINLGPTIPRLKSSHLKVILVFEDIPTGKRLYKDETVTSINLNNNRQMRSLISDILSTRFDPPIKLSQSKADRFCKIMSRTLVNYLKHWH
ncbi:uncharacterized protein LOC131667577 [Phymastichus coffea]|uniref:uncharacterized protein LOC131667577 n=1 Tax=Phymastichus coffea TaxID=108790 RepID=UPI00273AF60A|nr:uncharacterized protein LOC131667577 [Phymastichus coffea]